MNNIGSGTWSTLIDAGLVSNITDWMSLEHRQLSQISGIGSQRATQLQEAFDLTHQQPFARWLGALGTPPAYRLQPNDSWQTLQQLNPRAWQQRGYSLRNAEILHAFFTHSDLQYIADRLARAGIDGFVSVNPTQNGTPDETPQTNKIAE